MDSEYMGFDYGLKRRRKMMSGFFIAVMVFVLAVLVFQYGMTALNFIIDLGGDSAFEDMGTQCSLAVVDKASVIENRISYLDTWTQSDAGFVTKSQSVYYLVASDGRVCEVGLSDYMVTKVGDHYEGMWKRK